MFDLRKAPVARLLVPFTTGSLIGYQSLLTVPMAGMIIANLLLWMIMILVYVLSGNKNGSGSWVFCVTAFATIAATGFGTGMMTRPENPGLPAGKGIIIRGEIVEEPQIRKENWVFGMKLDLAVSDDSVFPVRTMVKVYLKMPEDSVLPAAGHSWQFYGQLSAVRNSGNPGSPNYESIMKRQNCWFRFFADNQNPVNRRRVEQDGRKMSVHRIKEIIWRHWNGDPDEISLLRAVCLGDRSGLTDDMRQSYSNAGGMHLLAVSGLHVGLIWWVLHHSLAWTIRLFRREVWRALIVVSLLWAYAFVTGFSSSVCRSVTMFTFFTLSRLLEQRTHPVNGILLSALLLIALNPGRILDVGFQLSYLAILGIVSLYPLFKRRVRIRNRLLRWSWEVTGISLSAQIVTAPLVVFYFHQLPIYSILTNLVAIPLLSILIAVFVISVPFMALGIATQPFNWLMFRIGYLLNLTMERVSSIPGSVADNLSLSAVNLTFLLILVLCVMMVPADRTHISRYLIALLIGAILVSSSLHRFDVLRSSELVVAHFNGGSLISFREGKYVDHYGRAGDPETGKAIDRYTDLVWSRRMYQCRNLHLDDTYSVEGSVSGCYPVLPGVWILGNSSITGGMICGSAFHGKPDPLEGLSMDFILLSEEPYAGKFLNHSGRDIIVDGSNGGWYILHPEPGNESIHYTAKRGAYRTEW